MRASRRIILAAPAALATACGRSQARQSAPAALPARPAAAPPTPAPQPTATAPPRLRPPITYAAIGASDTVGEGAADPAMQGWVPVLAAQLPPPVKLLNAGISGITLPEALDRELPQVLAFQPQLVSVWLAVNDLLFGTPLDQYTADLQTLIARLGAVPSHPYVAVANIPNAPSALDYVDLPQFPPAQRRALMAQWNAAIAGTVERTGAMLVDLFGRWPVADHPEYLSPDGFHPSTAGYRAIASVFYQTLREREIV